MINDNMLEEEIRNVERRFLRANPKDIENEPSDSNSYAIRVCGNRLRVDRDQFRGSETYYLYILRPSGEVIQHCSSSQGYDQILGRMYLNAERKYKEFAERQKEREDEKEEKSLRRFKRALRR